MTKGTSLTANHLKSPALATQSFLGLGYGEDIGQQDRRGLISKSRPLFAVNQVFLLNVTRWFERSAGNRPNRLFKRKSLRAGLLKIEARTQTRTHSRGHTKTRLPSITAATLPLRRLFTKLKVEPAKAVVNSSQYLATAGCW